MPANAHGNVRPSVCPSAKPFGLRPELESCVCVCHGNQGAYADNLDKMFKLSESFSLSALVIPYDKLFGCSWKTYELYKHCFCD